MMIGAMPVLARNYVNRYFLRESRRSTGAILKRIWEKLSSNSHFLLCACIGWIVVGILSYLLFFGRENGRAPNDPSENSSVEKAKAE